MILTLWYIEPKMKILIASNVSKKILGGMQQHQNMLEEEFKKLGHKVISIFYEDMWQPNFIGLSRITFPVLLVKKYMELERKLGRFDIVNIHEPMASFYCFYKKYIRELPPCVITVHNAEQKVWNRKLKLAKSGIITKPSIKTRITWPLFELTQAKFSIKNSDHILCLSREDLDFISDYYGIDDGKISIIKNGVSDDFFISCSKDYREIKILIISTWLENKGKEMIKSVINYLSKYHIKFTIAGFHQEVAQVLKEFPEHLHKNINLLPSFDREDIKRLLKEHHIYFLPSLYEGLPISLLESMAAELCPVVSAVGGIKDIITDGVNGILFDPTDFQNIIKKIESLLKTPDMINKIGKAAQRTVKEFTWEKVAKEILGVFEKVREKYETEK